MKHIIKLAKGSSMAKLDINRGMYINNSRGVTLPQRRTVCICKEQHSLPQRRPQSLFSCVSAVSVYLLLLCLPLPAVAPLTDIDHPFSSIVGSTCQGSGVTRYPSLAHLLVPGNQHLLEIKGVSEWMKLSAPGLEKVWDLQVNTPRTIWLDI